MSEEKQKKRRNHMWVDAILILEGMRDLNMNMSQIGKALGYGGQGTVSRWIKSGHMPGPAARALEALYMQHHRKPGVALADLSHDYRTEAPAPAPAPAAPAPVRKPEPFVSRPKSADTATVSGEGFFIVTKFVNDRAVWRTTVSNPKTMTMNGKQYMLVPV